MVGPRGASTAPMLALRAPPNCPPRLPTKLSLLLSATLKSHLIHLSLLHAEPYGFFYSRKAPCRQQVL